MLLSVGRCGVTVLAFALCSVAGVQPTGVKASVSAFGCERRLVIGQPAHILRASIHAVAASDSTLPHLRIIDPPILPGQRRLLQITWWSALSLVALCYAALLITFRSLKRLAGQVSALERPAGHIEIVEAGLQSFANDMFKILRPWLVISFELVRGKGGQYGIIATNRGIVPAELVGIVDRLGILSDESHLPATPEFAKDPRAPSNQVTLAPGETALLQTFGRTDLSWVCKTAEQLSHIEEGNQKIVIFGRVQYRSAVPRSSSDPIYETWWCCRYLHDEANGSLIPSGPREYRKHT